MPEEVPVFQATGKEHPGSGRDWSISLTSAAVPGVSSRRGAAAVDETFGDAPGGGVSAANVRPAEASAGRLAARKVGVTARPPRASMA